SNLPADTSLRRLVRTAKGRWWVEHSYKEMKDELGLDHFEGRGWRGWNHHVTLVLLAYTFLALRRRGRRKKGAPSEGRSRRCCARCNSCYCDGPACARCVVDRSHRHRQQKIRGSQRTGNT